ncbi:type II toxin-antitoxin system RelE/ParE family toxin [Anatilimnocola floriformis]|uniref:type II toxin-antitoxin system RelE/ParE family toxin n=1 Tax=Anatilimnocola floriformis TaxID=2948575 RepID=UPI0036F291D8
MSRKSIIMPGAARDLDEARDWYDEQSSGRGLLFLKAVEQKVEFVRNNPELFAIQHRRGRVAKVDRYPYIIVFTIDGNYVVIFAITHTSRAPETWQSRIP